MYDNCVYPNLCTLLLIEIGPLFARRKVFVIQPAIH